MAFGAIFRAKRLLPLLLCSLGWALSASVSKAQYDRYDPPLTPVGCAVRYTGVLWALGGQPPTGKCNQRPTHPLLPDMEKTPGVVRTSDAKEICNPKFRTKPYRLTTPAMKKHVCLAYGVKPCPKAKKMELDHLLPLELGGKDDERNLWVQFAPEFHYKDHLENYLKVQVCTERMSLADAQREITTNWVASYEKHIGKLP